MDGTHPRHRNPPPATPSLPPRRCRLPLLLPLQAEQLLGMTADELAALREGGGDGPQRYQAVLKGALWRDSVLRLKATAQEYQGEARPRYALSEIKATDYAGESRRLLALIAGTTATANAGASA